MCTPPAKKGVFHRWIGIIELESDVAEYKK